MVTQSWLFDAIIYIYALSLLFFFSDFVGSNREAKRMGTGLLIFVWVLQTLYLGFNLYEHRVMFVFTMFETLFLFSWLLATLSLIVHRLFRIELLVFFINVLGFSVLVFNFFSRSTVFPAVEDVNFTNELLFIHVTFSILSYAAFAISAIFSGMYLFLHRELKGKHWSVRMKRFPSLEKIDLYTFWSVIFGAPMHLLALSLGVVWIALQGNWLLLLDSRVIGSMFVLGVYGVYIIQRVRFRSSGHRLACWNLVAFTVVLLNFIFSNLFSGFHQWIWM